MIARAFAVTWTGHRVKPWQMRVAVCVCSGGDDAHGLTFQNGKRFALKIQNDVARVRVRGVRGQAIITLHDRLNGMAEVI